MPACGVRASFCWRASAASMVFFALLRRWFGVSMSVCRLSRCGGALLLALLLSLLLVGQLEARPRIALVLSGGGAKGAAHLGVLKVLEQERVPVDMVLGTSMGAYVAGMYAMGYSADEVTRKTLELDWNKGYQDKVTRQELSLRKKQQADKFQLQADLGLSDGKLKLPEGMYQGHGMAALLREATSNLPTLQSFDELPLPYRAVATDMAEVKPVVLDHGNLAVAMQASMSIPGALKPVEREGKLLSDGGIVNNLPVDIAKEMGADVVIAVDISDKLKPKEQLDSALSLVDQLTTYLTRSGTERQIALLGPNDILMSPDVSAYSVSDFSLMPTIMQGGEATARGMHDRLKPLALSEEEYRAYQEAKLDRRAQVSGQSAYYIDKIVLHNRSRLSDKVITSMLQVKAGQVQSNENLEAGIERINALGTFERITYQINQDKGQNVLEIEAGEKRWGPGYLDFNFAIEDDFQSRSNYSYGVAYTLTNLTPYGAEWRNEGIFGSWTHLSSELYAPFDAAQRFYGRVEGAYDKKERTVFFDNNPVWSSLTRSSSAESVRTNEGTWSTEAELGWNNRPWSQLALGNQWARSELSVDGVSGEETLYSWGPYLRYGYDTLNSRYFASEGTYLDSRLSYIRGWGGDVAEQDESWGLVSNLELIKPFALADRHTLSLRLAGGGSDVSELLPIYLQDLGGLFNLSGYQRYQLSGRYKLFGGLIYSYRLLDNDFGAFKSPLYIGGSFERGNIWESSGAIELGNMLNAGSLFVGSDTFLGPVYLAYGQAQGGMDCFYLFFGNTFGL